MRIKPRKPQSRSIAENFHRPFVELYDPDEVGTAADVPTSDDTEPDVLPLRMGKKAYSSFKKRRFAKATHCFLCGEFVPEGERTIDHITPESRGGPSAPSNLEMVCARCNRKKNDLTPIEWRDKLVAKIAIYQHLATRLEELIDEHGLDWFPTNAPPQAVIDAQRIAQDVLDYVI